MNKLKCVYSGELGGDCCSNQQFKPIEPMTVKELCDYAIKQDSWGTIEIKEANKASCYKIEYFNHHYCTDDRTESKELDFPNTILDSFVEHIDWYGGWGSGHWTFTLKNESKTTSQKESGEDNSFTFEKVRNLVDTAQSNRQTQIGAFIKDTCPKILEAVINEIEIKIIEKATLGWEHIYYYIMDDYKMCSYPFKDILDKYNLLNSPTEELRPVLRDKAIYEVVKGIVKHFTEKGFQVDIFGKNRHHCLDTLEKDFSNVDTSYVKISWPKQ